MSNAAALLFAERRAQLQATAPEWQKRIAYGDNTIGWRGDRYLQLYHNVVEDKMEIWCELPDRKPVLVMKVDAATFDINKALAVLRDADHRAQSPEEIIARVDRHNEAVEMGRAKQYAAMREAAHERGHWALRKDMGHHIAPMTVPRRVA